MESHSALSPSLTKSKETHKRKSEVLPFIMSIIPLILSPAPRNDFSYLLGPGFLNPTPRQSIDRLHPICSPNMHVSFGWFWLHALVDLEASTICKAVLDSITTRGR
jgi:hypothetical protein